MPCTYCALSSNKQTTAAQHKMGVHIQHTHTQDVHTQTGSSPLLSLVPSSCPFSCPFFLSFLLVLSSCPFLPIPSSPLPVPFSLMEPFMCHRLVNIKQTQKPVSSFLKLAWQAKKTNKRKKYKQQQQKWTKEDKFRTCV